MRTTLPIERVPKYYTFRETAWILGVAESDVWRLVRTGALPVVRRRSRLAICSFALARLLPAPTGEVAL